MSKLLFSSMAVKSFLFDQCLNVIFFGPAIMNCFEKIRYLSIIVTMEHFDWVFTILKTIS